LKILAAHGGGYLASYAPRSDHAFFVAPANCDANIVLKKKPSIGRIGIPPPAGALWI
jgi:aminocarboxymuconate-semialdehyde decarboxylase